MLFTSRNRAAQGLRLKVAKYPVGFLKDEASQHVLLAGGVQLDDAQLKVALDFCQGLPLALTLLSGALRAEDNPAYLIQHLSTHGTFIVDKEDQLISALSFSVECLSGDLQTAWLNLAWMYVRDAPEWVVLEELKCLFGEHTLQKLQDRSLITLCDWPFKTGNASDKPMVVMLHDVLLRMAEHMLGPHGQNYCLTLCERASISLSQAVKVC